ncbi:MAG: sulfite exporter TauE/SafE family protein [Hyphomicrobiaceae bacterium]
MPFDGTLALLLLGALLGGFVSGLAGFGGGPVVLVLWLLVIEPKIAVPLMMVSAVAHQVLTMHLIWKSISLERLLPMAIGGLAGTPVGAVLLGILNPVVVRSAVGIFLIAYTLTRLTYVRDLTLNVKSRWADAAAGAAAGTMSGLAGLPGPISTLWSGLRGWSKNEQRAVFQPFNSLMVVASVITFVSNGLVTGEVLRYALWCAPALALGVAAGTPLYLRLSDRQFHKIVLLLLLLMGVLLVAINFR